MGEEQETNLSPDLETKLAELDILRQSLEDVRRAEAKARDELLRSMADFQNYRKRTEPRISEARRWGREEVLHDLLGLADALDQAVHSSANASDVDSLKKGLSLVQQQFEKFLGDQGVRPIKSVGERLDPHKHEAVAQDIKEDVEEGTILQEVQRGYERDGHVIRTAKVRVSAKPKEEEKV